MFKLSRLQRASNLYQTAKKCFSSSQPILLYDKFKGFQNTALNSLNIPGVTIANTKEKALKALDVLYSLSDRLVSMNTSYLPIRPHAWDTETIDIEAKEEGPVGKGRIICATAFCGPEVDFGNGPSKSGY